MERNYKNKNRGYQQLRVWQQAVEFYAAVCRVFRCLPFELKKIASQEIASTDSVHRNIAEGYCRRSIREYLNFLNIAGDWVDHLHVKEVGAAHGSNPDELDTAPAQYPLTPSLHHSITPSLQHPITPSPPPP